MQQLIKAFFVWTNCPYHTPFENIVIYSTQFIQLLLCGWLFWKTKNDLQLPTNTPLTEGWFKANKQQYERCGLPLDLAPKMFTYKLNENLSIYRHKGRVFDFYIGFYFDADKKATRNPEIYLHYKPLNHETQLDPFFLTDKITTAEELNELIATLNKI